MPDPIGLEKLFKPSLVKQGPLSKTIISGRPNLEKVSLSFSIVIVEVEEFVV